MSVIPSDIAMYGAFCDPAYDGTSTLNGSIANTTVATLTINAASASTPFPPSGEFFILIDTEIMLVTQGAGTLNWTVVRGMCGTTAATHSNAATVTMPSGGGLDILTKLNFSDVVSGHTVDYVSSATADTFPQITVTGRDTTGVLVSETKTLNGQTIVTGSQAFDRLLVARLASGTTSTSNPLTSGGTTLTVTGHASFPTSGNYNIQMGREIMTVTAGQNTNSWTVTRAVGGTVAVAHQSGDNVYLCPAGDVAIVDHTKIITNHTAQTGSANPTGTTPALFKLQASDGATVAVGQIIRTQGGTGPQQIRTIIATSGYGTDVVAVSRSWSVVPDNTTTYDVWNGIQLDLAPNAVVECRRFLWNAAADVPGGSQKIFYQQVFTINNNTATALTAATVQDAGNTPALPSGALLDLATATAANDAQYVANRQTAFSTGYGSYVTQPAATAYGANSGNLASGAAPNLTGSQGVILRMTLPAGTTSYKGYADLRTTGATT